MFGAHAEGLHPHQAAKKRLRRPEKRVPVVGFFFFLVGPDAVFSGEVHGKLG